MSETVVAESGEHECAIGMNLGAGGDNFGGELDLIHGVGHLGQIEPHSAQTATGEPLDGDRDRRFLRCPAGLAVAAAAEEALVELDDAAKQLSFRSHHGAAQLVQPRPRGLIGAEPEGLL